MGRRGVGVGVSVGLCLVLGGCAGTVEHMMRPAPHSMVQREAGFTPEQEEWLAELCPAGFPVKSADWSGGATSYVVREGYALEHSCMDRIPLWVCEHVTPEALGEGAKRRNNFKADPDLAMDCRAELSDYRRSGFDRGHQAPAGDQSASQRLQDETFYLSNMAPQVGRGFNQQAWRFLETLVRDWVKDGVVGSEFVITGGFFYDPMEESADTADGMIPYERIGDGGVAVPTHFYKIVATQGEDGAWREVAFVMENKKYGSIDDFSQFIKPVSWIEERTGLDFMPDLGPVEGPDLEERPGTLFGSGMSAEMTEPMEPIGPTGPTEPME